MDIFANIVKEVEKATEKNWSGTVKENKMADTKVAMSIRNSFQNYERDRKDGDVSFFNFKRK